MLKVTIEGEVFSYDENLHPLAEAIELEEKLGMPFGEYQELVKRGSAKATAGLIWTVLKRNGRDVPLEDLLSGKYPINTDDLNWEDEGEDSGAGNPTGGSPGSPATGGSTSGSSPKSSATPPAKSAS